MNKFHTRNVAEKQTYTIHIPNISCKIPFISNLESINDNCEDTLSVYIVIKTASKGWLLHAVPKHSLYNREHWHQVPLFV